MAMCRDYAWEGKMTLDGRENYHSIATQRRHPLTALWADVAGKDGFEQCNAAKPA